MSKSKNKHLKLHVYVKIEFQNWLVRLSFLCHIMDIKSAWINSCLLDTGLELNVHKTFRRGLGCFLNVLYTLNLRRMTRGIYNTSVKCLYMCWSKILSEVSVSFTVTLHVHLLRKKRKYWKCVSWCLLRLLEENASLALL